VSARRLSVVKRPDTAASNAGAQTPPLAAYAADAIAGDEIARAKLVEALLPRARNLVRYLVRGDDESDDIVQDALVTVLERLENYRGEGRLERWADGVVMRVALHRLRRLRRRMRRFVSSPPDALEAYGEAVAITPPLRDYRERRQLVRALDRLPYKQRHALVLHHVLGMTVPEVARELAVPEETVHSRLRVGMKKLRCQLRSAASTRGDEA
jgi:RNA polymerase sigma-70 factor (ECF subfamily)